MQTRLIAVVFLAGFLALSACSPRESEEERHREANTPAGKVGQVAHKEAVELDKAGHAVGRQLDKAAHNAHEGWKEAAAKIALANNLKRMFYRLFVLMTSGVPSNPNCSRSRFFKARSIEKCILSALSVNTMKVGGRTDA